MKILFVIIFILTFSITWGQNEKERQKADEIINLIKGKEYEKVKECFLPKIKNSIPDSVLYHYIDLGTGFISQYGIPNYESVKVILTPVTSNIDKSIIDKERILLLYFEYTFPATDFDKTPKRAIVIGFIKESGSDYITSLQIIDNTKEN